MRARAVRAPLWVRACWAAGTLAGVGVLALGPPPGTPPNPALGPATLTASLQAVAGPGARAIRVNGLYGSGHHGYWEFVVHLSWLEPDGSVAGGSTTLPRPPGPAGLTQVLSHHGLVAEHATGWSLQTVQRVLAQVGGLGDPLATVELEVQADGTGTLTSCHAGPDGRAGCETRDSQARRTARFTDRLLDEPFLEGLSVQRAGKPVTPP